MGKGDAEFLFHNIVNLLHDLLFGFFASLFSAVGAIPCALEQHESFALVVRRGGVQSCAPAGTLMGRTPLHERTRRHVIIHNP